MPYISGSNRSVDTGDTYFREVSKQSISGSVVAKHALLYRDRLASSEVYDGKPLEARIEHARWIVDCPNCNNAEFAFEDKLFLCSLCKNSDIQGKVRKVKMPPQRKEIEDILGKRKIVNRHWFPTETIKMLEEENITYGIGV